MTLCVASFALLLMALASGMFLLAKTNKDNLGNFFRFASWFIIVSGFMGILLCGMMCMFRMCCHQGGGRMNEDNCRMEMRQGCSREMSEDGGNTRIIIKKMGSDDGEMECPGMQKECDHSSCSGSGDCCKDGKKEMHVEVKDTVIIKKK